MAATANASARTDRRTSDRGRRATDALKMACPFCGASESSVQRSRGLIVADVVRRRRCCAACGERFPTVEAVDLEELQRQLQDRARSGSQLAPRRNGPLLTGL